MTPTLAQLSTFAGQSFLTKDQYYDWAEAQDDAGRQALVAYLDTFQPRDQIAAATVTAIQVAAGCTDDWCYSDAFKDVYGYRPRGEYVNSPEYVAGFWNDAERLFAEAAEEDAQALAAACEAHGIEATTWMSYYDQREAQDAILEAKYRAEEEAAAAEKAEFYRRGSPAPVLEAWAHGA